MKKQELKDKFEKLLRKHKLKLDEKEYKFHKTRKWRSDYAWKKEKVMVELEGGVFTRGRHVRPSGFIGDCDKYNAAALDGWTLLRYTIEHVNNRQEEIIEQLTEALHGKEAKAIH